MWNSLPDQIQQDLIICSICLLVALIMVIKMVYNFIQDTRDKYKEIPVVTNDKEFTLTADKDGMASFVIIVDGKPHKITLKNR